MGSYDARHFLRTLCRAWRHPGQPVRVLSWDLDAAHVARHMLLLATALDFGLPRRERAQLLLELHGSCFLRERTAAYAEGRSKELLDVVAAASEGRRAAGVLGRLLDLSQLKFRERDDVADALRGLSRRVQFDMARAREHRQRRFLGERYDARDAAADWDYQMRWREVAPIVRARNFKGWRASGVAARLRDARYEQPNRSLAATAAGRAVEEYDRITGAPKGRSITKRGFWGDILTGPFAAFGVEADDPRLFETANKEHKHDEQAVAEHNLLQMLHELEEACEYAPPNPDEAFGGEGEGAEGGEQGDNSEEPSAVDIGDGDGDTATEPPAAAAAALARCLLTFVMGDPVKQIFGRAKYASHFHAVTLGCRDVHWPSHGLAKVGAQASAEARGGARCDLGV